MGSRLMEFVTSSYEINFSHDLLWIQAKSIFMDDVIHMFVVTLHQNKLVLNKTKTVPLNHKIA
jgi:hypothetical protein